MERPGMSPGLSLKTPLPVVIACRLKLFSYLICCLILIRVRFINTNLHFQFPQVNVQIIAIAVYYNVCYEFKRAIPFCVFVFGSASNAASIESDKFRTVTFPVILFPLTKKVGASFTPSFIPAIRSSCT